MKNLSIMLTDAMYKKVIDHKLDSSVPVQIVESIRHGKEIRWIPVSERLPEDGKTVIASVKGCIYPEARYVKEYGWEWAYESGADYWEELEDVSAWMPLPKPYKVESEGE